MKLSRSDLSFIFLRYLAVILIGLGNLFLFYWIFTPLTVSVFYSIVSIFTNANLIGNIVVFNGNFIEIIPSCVSGAAYYLLFSLAMLTKMDYKKRINAILLSVSLFFLFNIIRLLTLTLILGSPSFEIFHWLSWNVISTVFVVLIWIFVVKKYKISEIPLYSDIKYIRKGLKRKKPKRKK